jgi:hypothetical protein
MDKTSAEKPRLEADDTIDVGEVLNVSGHKQELDRQFSLLSICSIGITTGNVWAALGGSIVGFPNFLCFICIQSRLMFKMKTSKALC